MIYILSMGCIAVLLVVGWVVWAINRINKH